jgi:AraC-like DNA-binding protein
MKGRRILLDGAAFPDVVDPYVRACPGPALAETGLRMVAYQRIAGIPGLELPTVGVLDSDGESGTRRIYLRSVVQVAARVNCSPTYLSEAARRRGYSYSKALRWLRLLHGLVLRDGGVPLPTMVWRLGFNDPAGWNRFTKRLIGRTPSQIPAAPMDFWVRMAIEHVYLNGQLRGGEGSRGRRNMPDDK